MEHIEEITTSIPSHSVIQLETSSIYSINYYLTKLLNRNAEPVEIYHLSYFLYPYDTLQYLLTHEEELAQRVNSNAKLLDLVNIYENLNLKQIFECLKAINRDIDERETVCTIIIVLEGLEDAYSIDSFYDYSKAGALISNIMRLLRRSTQKSDCTVILHHKHFHVKYVGKIVASMLDYKMSISNNSLKLESFLI
ncbi:hypothetical protein DAMA08_049170 [Martiniozyma asiatica (nom. inval.)]|nr:hypothetical protein DAMA08_049170 [Martiniozyma asiatica]